MKFFYNFLCVEDMEVSCVPRNLGTILLRGSVFFSLHERLCERILTIDYLEKGVKTGG